MFLFPLNSLCKKKFAGIQNNQEQKDLTLICTWQMVYCMENYVTAIK